MSARRASASPAPTAAPLIADDLRALDADERRDVSEPCQCFGDLVGDELAVREHLEITVRMRGEQIEQLWVHEWLAAQDSEIGIAVGFRVADDRVQLLQRQLLVAQGSIEGAGQHDATAAGLRCGQQDVDGADEVGLQCGKHRIQRPRTAHVAGEMEDQIGLHCPNKCERPFGVAKVGRPPADGVALLSGT